MESWKVKTLDMENCILKNRLDRFCANTVHYNLDIAYLINNKIVNMDNILIKMDKTESFEN